jgi:hypothetical protein
MTIYFLILERICYVVSTSTAELFHLTIIVAIILSFLICLPLTFISFRPMDMLILGLSQQLRLREKMAGRGLHVDHTTIYRSRTTLRTRTGEAMPAPSQNHERLMAHRRDIHQSEKGQDVALSHRGYAGKHFGIFAQPHKKCVTRPNASSQKRLPRHMSAHLASLRLIKIRPLLQLSRN